MLRSLFVLLLLSATALAQSQPIPAKDAPAKMTAPEGFRVTLFAGEPDVVQPIAFTFDHRGRMWVVECLSYPQWEGGPIVAGQHPKGNDRVTIFEDTNGDGTFDTRKVFWDKGSNLTGIELGFGGVYLTAVPNLIFIADKNGDDVPDSAPAVLLDGWDLKAKHNVVNGLKWGPDGWLWGCNGILSNSKVGKPGAPANERVDINCGVWRFHPIDHRFEVVAHGTTNPWGLDFDDYGEAFITNCVIHHLWHIVPGGHYERMFGNDMLPNSYQLMKSCADYIHWAGGHWTSSRGGQGAHSDAGGGHAHSGAAIYMGTQFPPQYQNSLFTCNIHGSRLNRDGLQRGKHSGYAAQREKDFVFANDPWFRGIAVHLGPDGSLYVSDWSDTGECHNYVEVDRRNGRIYRISYGKDVPKSTTDLSKLSDVVLADFCKSSNEVQVRHARRLLQERSQTRKIDPLAVSQMIGVLNRDEHAPRILRALWALHAIGALDEPRLRGLIQSHPNENVRAWAVRLALENRTPSADLRDLLAQRAIDETSPFVRLYLAAGLQRIPVEQRWPIANALAAHAEDANDPYLPLMLWYGVEAIPAADLPRAVNLTATTRIPLIREFLTRRIAGLSPLGLKAMIQLLADVDASDAQLAMLRGIQEVLKGQRAVPMPADWSATYANLLKSANAEVQQRAMLLAVVFDDAAAMEAMRGLVRDAKADRAARLAALDALVFKQKPETLTLIQGLLNDEVVRAAVIRHLAVFDDAKTPALLLAGYPRWSAAERVDAIATLSSRASYAQALLDAIDKGTIPRADVSTFTIRQLQGLKDASLNARITKVWGEARATSNERKAQIAKWKDLLNVDALKKADPSNGRVIYQKNCASCHKLFDEGGKIGPELTGSQRKNLDYVLENVLDPNAVVAREYLVTALELQSGRTINGIIVEENDQAVTVQTPNERILIPKKDIAEREQTKVSMMPEGLFDKLKPEEVRDLIAYLSSN